MRMQDGVRANGYGVQAGELDMLGDEDGGVEDNGRWLREERGAFWCCRGTTIGGGAAGAWVGGHEGVSLAVCTTAEVQTGFGLGIGGGMCKTRYGVSVIAESHDTVLRYILLVHAAPNRFNDVIISRIPWFCSKRCKHSTSPCCIEYLIR